MLDNTRDKRFLGEKKYICLVKKASTFGEPPEHFCRFGPNAGSGLDGRKIYISRRTANFGPRGPI